MSTTSWLPEPYRGAAEVLLGIDGFCLHGEGRTYVSTVTTGGTSGKITIRHRDGNVKFSDLPSFELRGHVLKSARPNLCFWWGKSAGSKRMAAASIVAFLYKDAAWFPRRAWWMPFIVARAHELVLLMPNEWKLPPEVLSSWLEDALPDSVRAARP